MSEYRTTLQRREDALLDFVLAYERQFTEYDVVIQDWIDRLPSGFVQDINKVTAFYDKEREKANEANG